MNLLSLSIGSCEKNTTADGVSFLVEVLVDGVSLPEYLDVDEFFRSLSQFEETAYAKRTKTKPNPKKARMTASVATKLLPIFNCSCGCFGCGGFYVQVTQTREALVWESAFVHSSRAAGREKVRYAFSWANVRSVAGELITAIIVAARQHPHCPISSGATGEDLVERLPFYRGRYVALAPIVEK